MDELNKYKVKINKELESYREKLIDSLRNDKDVYPLIKSLGINSTNFVRDNIAALADFQEDYHYCKNCPGYDKCNKEFPHFRINLTNDSKHISKSLYPCELAVKKSQKDARFYVSDFADEWRTTATIKGADKSEARKKVLMRYNEAIKSKSLKWIYMEGGPRKGKSFMAACLANDFANKYGEVAFINSALRLKDLLSSYYDNKEDFSEKINKLSTIPLLIIDDFGNEYKSDFIRDTILFPILNDRFHNNLLTIFTSQFSYEDIQNMYSLSKASSVRAKQLKNMLMDACGDTVDFSGISIY